MAIEFIAQKPGVWHYGCTADDRDLSITLSRTDAGGAQTWMCEIILEDLHSCAAANSSPTYRCTWGLPVERVVPQAKFEVEAINRWERLPFVGAVLTQRWVFKR